MAATSFREGIMSLSTAGGNLEKKRALAMLGLKPGDVDFVGEDFSAVQTKLTGAFQGVPGDKRNIAAKLLFGDQGIGFYNTLIQPGAGEEFHRRVAMAQDPAGAKERRDIAESGTAAQQREATTLETQALFDRNLRDPDVARKRLQAVMRNMGLNEADTARINAEWDDPGMYGEWDDWMYGTKAEDKAKAAAYNIRYWMRGRLPFVDKPSEAAALQEGVRRRTEGIEQQILGERPIRIIGPDGLDIPHEPAAIDLNESGSGVDRILNPTR